MIISTTIVIYAMVEHSDRIDNLKLVLPFINKFLPKVEVIFVHYDNKPDLFELVNSLHNKVRYIFVDRKDKKWNSGQVFNTALHYVNTNSVINWDVDCVIRPAQILSACSMCTKDTPYVIPYTNFYNINKLASKPFENSYDFTILDSMKISEWVGMGPEQIPLPMTGGMQCFHTQFMKSIHGYDERQWGRCHEDSSINLIIHEKLRYNRLHVEGSLYHIDHYRSPESSEDSGSSKTNYALLLNMRALSTNEFCDKYNIHTKLIHVPRMNEQHALTDTVPKSVY